MSQTFTPYLTTNNGKEPFCTILVDEDGQYYSYTWSKERPTEPRLTSQLLAEAVAEEACNRFNDCFDDPFADDYSSVWWSQPHVVTDTGEEVY